MRSDTGESMAAMRRRYDDMAWPKVEAALKEGATLFRPLRLDAYYIDRGDGPSGPSLSKTRVRKLEAEGILRIVGEFRFALAKAGAS